MGGLPGRWVFSEGLRIVIHRPSPRAFTLVELLVVIGLIVLLMGLVLPATQGVREAARRSQCGNNVSQLAKAVLAHETAHGFYPSGGWGYFWVGDADRGFGRSQPGGWLYSCLPYLDQSAAWSLPSDGDPVTIGDAQRAGATRLARTTLPTVMCPSRRPNQLLPKVADGTFIAGNAANNPSDDNRVARTDYAINAGTLISGSFEAVYWYVPATNTVERRPSGSSASATYLDWPGGIGAGWSGAAYPATITFPGANVTLDGLAYNLSEVRVTDVTDGASMTYLLGERNCHPDEYSTGTSGCDNETWIQGTNNDALRSGRHPPAQDTPGLSPCTGFLFGGPHALSFSMAFTDGAVRWIRYDIDPKVHWGLSDRAANHADVPVIPGGVVR